MYICTEETYTRSEHNHQRMVSNYLIKRRKNVKTSNVIQTIAQTLILVNQSINHSIHSRVPRINQKIGHAISFVMSAMVMVKMRFDWIELVVASFASSKAALMSM